MTAKSHSLAGKSGRLRPSTGREVELKLLATPADLARIPDLSFIREHVAGDEVRGREVTTYFDTPDFSLARRGVALRVRRKGARRVQTVKTLGAGDGSDGAGVAVRREWEWPLTSDQPDLGLLQGQGLDELVPPGIANRLEPLFCTDIQRTLLPLRVETGARLEMALDIGEARAWPQRQDSGGTGPHRTISEVELELAHGDVGALFRTAAAIHDRIPLRLTMRSKADIGLSLLTGAQAKAVPARPLALTPITTVTEAFRHVARNGLAHMLDNQDAFATDAGADPEILRELAAATRRLDTGYSLFRDLINTAQGDGLHEGLQALARPLEKARRWQRLAQAVTDLDPAIRKSALGPVSAARQKALAKARNVLLSPAWTGWQLGFAVWLEGGEWTSQPQSCPFGTAMGEVAGDLLARRLGKVLKAGRPLSRQQLVTADHVVPLHKQIRKLRYALDFCRAVWPAERVRALLEVMDTLRPLVKQAADAERGARLLADIGLEEAASAMRRQWAVPGAAWRPHWEMLTGLVAQMDLPPDTQRLGVDTQFSPEKSRR